MSGLLLKLAAVVAGAAMLTTSPAAASYSITDDSIRPVPSVATVSKDAPGQDAPTPAPHPGTIEVSIPRVSFTADVRVVNGRVRTPVLVNVAAAPGIARVTGSRGACVERLTPGQVAWIDCAVRSRGPVAIVVALRDGTAATRVVRRCRPQGPPAAVPTRSSRPRLPLAPTTTRGRLALEQQVNVG